MHLSQFWLSKKLPFSLIYELLSPRITETSPPTVLYSQARKGIRNIEYENLRSEFQRTGFKRQLNYFPYSHPQCL